MHLDFFRCVNYDLGYSVGGRYGAYRAVRGPYILLYLQGEFVYVFLLLCAGEEFLLNGALCPWPRFLPALGGIGSENTHWNCAG